MNWNRRREAEESSERGQSLVEFALLVPLLLIIVAGVLDLGRLYFAFLTITDAAAEGVTYATIHPPDATAVTCPASPTCASPDDVGCICLRAQTSTEGAIEIAGDDVEITCLNCPTPPSGTPVTVTVRYDFQLATPFMNVIVPEGVLPLEAVASEAILTGAME